MRLWQAADEAGEEHELHEAQRDQPRQLPHAALHGRQTDGRHHENLIRWSVSFSIWPIVSCDFRNNSLAFRRASISSPW